MSDDIKVTTSVAETIEHKKALREELREQLIFVNEKINKATKVTNKLKDIHRALAMKFQKLDRQIFEATKGITKVKSHGITKTRTSKSIFDDVEKMSQDDRDILLAQLVKAKKEREEVNNNED